MSARHEWSDDVAPYLLGALPGPDASRFEAHLATCTMCQADLDELKPVVEGLPTTVEEIEPPASLKRAIMAEVERDAAAARVVREGSRSSSARRGGAAPSWFRRPLPVLAAACAALIVGIGVGVGVTGSSDTPDDAKTYAGTCAPGCRASLELEDGDGTLHVAKMPAAPDGRVYQVWLMRKGSNVPEPTDALFNASNGGTATVDVPGDLHDVVRVLVSEEPRGGSKAPTTAPGIDVQVRS
ncbi:MAG TPA: anti-sigma factor [Solirubrobacteraceae bacterium]|nr:anti-sigma factor [Solirubrobacteraceae bacterium]